MVISKDVFSLTGNGSYVTRPWTI